MRTTLTIDCDIRDAQAILYEASKIIRDAETARDQDRLVELVKTAEFPEESIKYDDRKEWDVMCPDCDWTGYIMQLMEDADKDRICPKCHGHIIVKEGAE